MARHHGSGQHILTDIRAKMHITIAAPSSSKHRTALYAKMACLLAIKHRSIIFTH